MTKTARTAPDFRFETFEVDLQAGELRKNGAKLKLSGQPFQVLTILLERPGEVVTREELQKRLWPDTFVDVDHNLNTAINKIREALGDSAETPRFVETLPRRGYRFIGEVERPVEPVETPAAVPITVEPDRVSDFRKLRWKVTAGVLTIATVVVAAGVIYRRSQQQPPQQQAVLTAVPFTALPGRAISPAFSPDGSRIAFAWNGDPASGAKGFDLYVKALGSETLIRLTQRPSEWISPTWSPEGTQIAFHRIAGADTGIYVVPALGGPERKLRSTRMPWGQFMLIAFSLIAWSPDGKWIAFAEELPGEGEVIKINLLSIETLEARQIPIPTACANQGAPAFSHDGEYLAYWCDRGADSVIYSLPLLNGEPKALATFRAVQEGLTWSADDKKLIYSIWNYGPYALGEVSVATGLTNQLDFAGSASLPTVSSKGNKLAYSSPFTSSGIWRRDLLHPEAPAVELHRSSRKQFGAQYSPDGKRIAFASLRSGLQGVWIGNGDGSNLVQISNPAQPSGSPQWSPDGNRIAFDSLSGNRWEIYVIDVAEQKPRKLITNISGLIRPHWSRDGKWVYFTTQLPGRIYRCPASGGDAIAVSKDIDGYSPQESFDGKTLYFGSKHDKSTLKQVALPTQPGTESKVDGMPLIRNADLWTLSRAGIYFVPYQAPGSLRYFDFATRQVRPIFEVEKDFYTLSMSPDSRWIIYSLVGDENSDIMLVDHFH